METNLQTKERWAWTAKPGQQRTRVMFSHLSHCATLDNGEGCGKVSAGAGEQRWGKEAKRGMRSSAQVWAGSHLCVCVADLESDGVAGVVEVMWGPQGTMGKDDQWQTTSCHRDTLVHTNARSATLFRVGRGGQTENKSSPRFNFSFYICVYLSSLWTSRCRD